MADPDFDFDLVGKNAAFKRDGVEMAVSEIMADIKCKIWMALPVDASLSIPRGNRP